MPKPETDIEAIAGVARQRRIARELDTQFSSDITPSILDLHI
jgi:hypothetical protein